MKRFLNTLFVTSEDIYLSLEGENVLANRDREVVARYPLHTLQTIVSFSYSGASPALMGACAEKGIGLAFCTPRGKFLARVCGESNGNVLLRREQYRVADDPHRSCAVARDMIFGKLSNSGASIQRTLRDHAPRVQNCGLEDAASQIRQLLSQVLAAADLEALLGESVVRLTGRDLALRDIEVASRQEEQRRLRALDALSAGAAVAVCTVSGLLQRTLPPEVLENAAFTLTAGEGDGPEALEPRLLACGYRRSDMVEGPGQFSRRGGILDIFSPGAERPVRAEFWGDEIDSMGFFDTDTQRRAENIESFRVLPACESLVDPGRADSIAKALLSRAARAERRG